MANKLKENLEAGIPIAGMKGYVPFDEDETVYVQVKVLKINTSDCTMRVEVEPCSGAGVFLISPCKWVDSPKDINKIKDQLERTKKADEEVKDILRSSYAKAKKQRLANYVETRCNAEQKDSFYAQVVEECGERNILKLCESTTRWLARVVAYEVNGVIEPVEKRGY